MKKHFTYCLPLFFLLINNIVSAEIIFTISKTDVACNNSSLGKIDVTVSSTNPPYTYHWNSGQTTSTIYDLRVGNYTLTITDGLGKDTIVTIPIYVIECEMSPEIVFTPNGDNHNDTWFITNAQYFPNALVLVYNRLGQKVYEHKGLYEPWDGKDLLGVPVPDASYYFIVYKDKDDEKSIKKGAVSIIR
jgi:gliding motility-associated-like protein